LLLERVDRFQEILHGLGLRVRRARCDHHQSYLRQTDY
jgi:hypothetical protein